MRFLRLRMLLVTTIAIVLSAFFIASGRRDLTLLLGKEATIGRVTKVYQPPAGRVRASDYQVWYEFQDASGVTHAGEDVLPPAYPPSVNSEIKIAYSLRDPSVSRIASQVSTTPLEGLLLALAALAWVAVQFIRMRRSRSAS